MNKELTEKLEGVRAYLVSQNANRSACAVDEAIVALRAEPVAGQLSAEQIAGIKACLLDGTYTPAEIADFSALCDMALSSLRGTFADGIEAAAKVFLQHHAVTQDQGILPTQSSAVSAHSRKVNARLSKTRASCCGKSSIGDCLTT